MDLPTLNPSVCRIVVAIAAWIVFAVGLPTAEAAQSIRVLLSADVAKLDVQAEGAVWLTDASRHGRAPTHAARS